MAATGTPATVPQPVTVHPHPRGSLLAMPLVLFNMGVEMMYILDQRLKAQAIPVEKATRVLIETVRSMFSQTMLSTVFEPTPVYSQKATRHVFDELAHSSIMRLNKQSMDKLYDLMTMGWKYQVLHAVGPRALLDITALHLEQLKSMMANHTEAVALIDSAKATVDATYSTLPMAELCALKSTILRFLQDRRVKVSLFVAEGRRLQLNDGTIVLDGMEELPPGTEMPGTVRYFDKSGKVTSTEKMPALTTVVKSTAVAPETSRLPFPLGCNIYAKDKRKGRGGQVPEADNADVIDDDADSKAKVEEDDALATRGPGSPAGAPSTGGLLAAILRSKTGGGSADDSFTPQLFSSLAASSSGGGLTLSFDGHASGAGRGDLAAMAARLGLDDGGSTSTPPKPGKAAGAQESKEEAKGGDDDDLLALLDEAGS